MFLAVLRLYLVSTYCSVFLCSFSSLFVWNLDYSYSYGLWYIQKFLHICLAFNLVGILFALQQNLANHRLYVLLMRELFLCWAVANQFEEVFCIHIIEANASACDSLDTLLVCDDLAYRFSSDLFMACGNLCLTCGIHLQSWTGAM